MRIGEAQLKSANYRLGHGPPGGSSCHFDLRVGLLPGLPLAPARQVSADVFLDVRSAAK